MIGPSFVDGDRRAAVGAKPFHDRSVAGDVGHGAGVRHADQPTGIAAGDPEEVRAGEALGRVPAVDLALRQAEAVVLGRPLDPDPFQGREGADADHRHRLR